MHLLGIPAKTPHRKEQWVAALGSLLGILAVAAIIHALPGRADSAIVLVPSLGGAAVLVFAAPHSLFAQPWSVIGGNIISALVGVACQKLIPEPALAAAMAVSLAIVAMHVARCMHPPGGATALAAIVGGAEIQQLGFTLALIPVGLGCLVLVAVGVAFNYPFAWRRYPASLMHYAHAKSERAESELLPDEHQIQQVLERLDVVVDVSPEELLEVIEQSLVLAREERASKLRGGKPVAP